MKERVRTCLVLQKRLHDMPDSQHAQVRVRLARADEVDGLAGHVSHRERGADLRVGVDSSVSDRAPAQETRLDLQQPSSAVGRKDEYPRTLSSIVSNLVRIIPSTPRPLPGPLAPPAAPAEPEKSRSERLNFVSWSTASLPTSASPTKMILSGWLTAMSCGRRREVSRGEECQAGEVGPWRERA